MVVSQRVCTAQPFDLCQNCSDRGQKVNWLEEYLIPLSGMWWKAWGKAGDTERAGKNDIDSSSRQQEVEENGTVWSWSVLEKKIMTILSHHLYYNNYPHLPRSVQVFSN